MGDAVQGTCSLFLCCWGLCLHTTGLRALLRWLPRLFLLVILTASFLVVGG